MNLINEFKACLTGKEQLLLSIILVLSSLPGFHGSMRLQESLSLSSVCQILSVHAS